MIKKYYVTCADLKTVTHAHSGPQAIFFALDQMGSAARFIKDDSSSLSNKRPHWNKRT